MAGYRTLSYHKNLGGLYRGVGGDVARLTGLTFGTKETADVNSEILPITKSYVYAQEGSTGVTDEIQRITGGAEGDILLLRCATSILIKDGTNDTGGLHLESSVNFQMTSPDDTIWFVYYGSRWLELARSNNS